MTGIIETGKTDFSVAVIGPGQSGQEIGMGSKLAKESKAARRVWGMTNEILYPQLGYNFTDLVWDRKINGMEASPEDALAELTQTPNTQVAVFTDSIARWEAGREIGAIPDVCVHTGFSLGRFTASYTSGAIENLEDAIRLVRARGDAFYLVKGWLAALIDVEPEFTQTIMRDGREQVGDSFIYFSMHNTPTQIVIGGKEDSRPSAKAWLDDHGLEEKSDYVWVAVSGPFHTPDMEPSRTPFAEDLRKARIGEPTRGILIGNNGKHIKTPDEINQDLLDQTTERQSFYGSGGALYDMGVTRMVCLSSKTTEVNMLTQIGKSLSRQGVRTPIAHQYSSDENPTVIAYQLKTP